jgi:ACS family D-galactonate transporter-like MFS transporter
LQNGFANLAGVVAPALTGFLVDRSGNFLAPLAIAAAVLVVGGLSWVFAVGRVEQVSWKSVQHPASVVASSFQESPTAFVQSGTAKTGSRQIP